MTTPIVRLLVVALALLAALTGCGADDKPRVQPDPPTAAPPPAPPRAGTCYRLDFAEAARLTSTARPVSCQQPHTSETFFVGRIDPVRDGHLVAIDSDQVVRQIARACPRRFREYVGGDTETRRLSRLETVWFSPTLAQSDRGETWFRCDLIALAGKQRLMNLPRRTRHFLDGSGVLDDFGTCGTARPDKPAFVRVACRRPHRWRAVSTVDLIAGARYGGKRATDAAETACRDVAATHSDDPLKYEWSFEWPNRDLWVSGQRWGLCWVPSTD